MPGIVRDQISWRSKLRERSRWRSASPEKIEKWKEDLRNRMKGNTFTPIEALRKQRTGKSHVEIFGEEKAKVMRELNSQKHKGRFMKEHYQMMQGCSVILRKERGTYLHKEETKKALSEESKRLWKSPDYVRKQMRARKVYPNQAELFLGRIIDEMFPGEYKYVGDGQVIISGKCPDFININGQKKIIELFGEFFHRPEEELVRKELFRSLGYKTLIVWGKELQDTRALRTTIREFHGDLFTRPQKCEYNHTAHSEIAPARLGYAAGFPVQS